MPSKSSIAIARLVRTPLAQRMLQEMQLAGLAERTHESYLRAVSKLAAHTKTAPDRITEEQLREYLLVLRNEKEFAAGSLKVAFSGIQFFYRQVVKREWETLQKLRVPEQRKLPAVLSRDEVRELLDAVRTPHNRAFFITVYTLGLRLQEGLYLEVGDIDSRRKLVRIHRGKGARDRYVPLSVETLRVLREYWRTHKHPTLLDQIPSSVWQEAWVVHSKAVGDGRKAMRYLAPYVYRVAISNSRIETIEDTPDGQGWVTFTYRQSGSNRQRRMKVTAFEFLRRFLQHVLPPGFQKVRYYGFLSARRRDQFEHVRWLATLAQGQIYELTSLPGKPVKVTLATCPKCGNVLTLIAILPRSVLLAALAPQPAMVDTS